jgi:diguanylate cyclase (GGDEF)-like protein/PAS domain S-box-containing protein
MARKFLVGSILLVVGCGLALWALGQAGDADGEAFLWGAVGFAVGILCSLPLARRIGGRDRQPAPDERDALIRQRDALLAESNERFRLVAENASDIVLRTDREGLVRFASPAVDRLGFLLPGELIGRQLVDLVHPSYAGWFTAEHEAAIAQRRDRAGLEFRALASDGAERWFEADMRCLIDADDEACGVIVVLRDIAERKAFAKERKTFIEENKALEEKLFAASLTDPLTHLTNRHAFVSMLQYLVDMRIDGCLALFEIDYFKSINLQHGHAVGDEVLITFTDLARQLVRSDDIISRIGGGRFGILFPRATPDQTEAVCQRIVKTLSDASRAVGADTLRITVSGGVSRIGDTLDETMKKAEMAVVVARAKGRDRLEMATRPRLPWAPDPQGS